MDATGAEAEQNAAYRDKKLRSLTGIRARKKECDTTRAAREEEKKKKKLGFVCQEWAPMTATVTWPSPLGALLAWSWLLQAWNMPGGLAAWHRASGPSLRRDLVAAR